MKKQLLTFCLLSASSLSGLAHADNPLAAVPDPYTQPEAAKMARVAVHQLMLMNLVDGIKIAATGAKKGAVPPPGMKAWNGLRLNDRTDSLQALAKMSDEFFYVPGSFEGTNAKPSILDNINDFKAKSFKAQTAATGLSLSDRNHDAHGAFSAIGALIQACNACHAEYMENPLLLPLPGQ